VSRLFPRYMTVPGKGKLSVSSVLYDDGSFAARFLVLPVGHCATGSIYSTRWPRKV